MTRIDEIGPAIWRLSTFVPGPGIVFNQFLLGAEEPLLFHTGPRALFPAVHEAIARVVDPARLRWISFGHYEADECGAMNQWLAAAPRAEVAHGGIGAMVSLADQADRPPRALADGEVLDLGGRRVRWIATPHVPHGWDAGVILEETTRTLFAGDLFTQLGEGPAVSDQDIVGPALDAEDRFGFTALGVRTAPAIAGLARLDTATLALMHGPAFTGDTRGALSDLAAAYAARLAAALDRPEAWPAAA